MPIIKFVVFTTLALLAVIVGVESMSGTVATAVSRDSGGALAGLRAMANRGDAKHVSAAAAGPFLPVDVAVIQSGSTTPASRPAVEPAKNNLAVADAEPAAVNARPVIAAPAPMQPALLNAQASVENLAPKPVKRKIAARKSKTFAAAPAPFESRFDNRYGERRVYVQNAPRGFDFFGAIQSW